VRCNADKSLFTYNIQRHLPFTIHSPHTVATNTCKHKQAAELCMNLTAAAVQSHCHYVAIN